MTPEEDVRAIVRTAAEAFPHVSVWHSPELYSWVINGSVDPRPPDLQVLARHFADPRVRADLESIALRDPADFLAYFVMAGPQVDAWTAGAPVITDDRTRLDFTVPRSLESNYGLSNSNTNDWLLNLMSVDPKRDLKAARMCSHKRPVAPHLTNGDGSAVELAELAARVEALVRSREPRCVGGAG
jgi:hypothetical protein